ARQVPDDLFPGPRGVAPRPGNTGGPNSDVQPALSRDRHCHAEQAEGDGTRKGAAGSLHGRGRLFFYRLSIIARTVVTASTIVKRDPPPAAGWGTPFASRTPGSRLLGFKSWV